MRRREGKMWFLPLLLFLLGLGILLYPTVHGAMVDWKMKQDSQRFLTRVEVIDMILAILLFVKIATAYMDYRKHGQFEFTAPAILFACLLFALTAPSYIWSILG